MIPMGKISHFMHMCMNFVLFLMSPIFIFKYFTSYIEEMMNKVLYFNEVFYKNGITFVAFFWGDTSSKIVVERKEWHYSINRFNPATFLCLFQARTWISNVICCRSFFMFNELRCRGDCTH